MQVNCAYLWVTRPRVIRLDLHLLGLKDPSYSLGIFWPMSGYEHAEPCSKLMSGWQYECSANITTERSWQIQGKKRVQRRNAK